MATESVLGLLLRTYRETRGWSQEALAAAANVSARTLQRLESGETQDTATVDRVRHALGVTQAELDKILILTRTLPTMIRVPRVRDGDELARLVRGAHAFLPHFLSEDRRIRDAANSLITVCEEWDGLLDEPEALLAASEHLSQHIAALEAAGAKPYATSIKVDSGHKDAAGRHILFDTLVLAVRESGFLLNLEDEMGEHTYLGTEQTVAAVREHERSRVSR